jgi:hypothetical protein
MERLVGIERERSVRKECVIEIEQDAPEALGDLRRQRGERPHLGYRGSTSAIRAFR